MVTKATVRILVSFLLLWGGLAMAGSKDVPRISKEEVNAMLGRPDVVIIDVRTFFDRKMSTMQIQGAVREDPDPAKVKSWAKKYSKEKTVVLYCA